MNDEAGEQGAEEQACVVAFFFSSRRRHTRFDCDWSSDVCSSDLEDVGNLRAAADWFEQDPTAVDDNLLFATGLHWFWFGLGHYREARRRIETALERSGGARTRARGRALSSLAMYFALQGERVAIGPVAEESVAILRETAGPSVDLVCALVALGQSRLLAGDLAGAAHVLAEALGVARAVRPDYWITYALYWQGCVAQASGDLAAARAAFDEGVALALEGEIGRAAWRGRG